MRTPWTKLEGTELWEKAKDQYDANQHAYHSFEHVRTLYYHAEALGLPYDISLDRAILAHDVILDGQPRPEYRSAQWLQKHLPQPDEEAAGLIMSTVQHIPGNGDSRLAVLDLMNFTRPETRRRDSRLLFEEAKRREGVEFDPLDWVHGTLGYLDGLGDRIARSLEEDQMIPNRDKWERILHGLRCTMTVLPLVYAPHPAQGIQRYTTSMEATLALLVAGDGALERDLTDETGVIDIPGFDLQRSLAALKHQGLAFPQKSDAADQLWMPSDEGREFIEKLNAPHEDWAEPEF